jgi:hypothetical protein
MYLLHETVIDPSDENSLLSIRNEINNDKTEVTGNGTNVITITNSYVAPHGSALPKDFVVDNLLTFKDTVSMGTQVFVKKNGVHIKTYTFLNNTKFIWLSDILNTTREALYTKVNEVYELSFIYNQYINRQLESGYYREFNPESLFKLNSRMYTDILPDEKYVSILDISYNINFMRDLFGILTSIYFK